MPDVPQSRYLAFLLLVAVVLSATTSPVHAQSNPVPPPVDPRLYEIAEAPSAERIEADIRKLAEFRDAQHALGYDVRHARHRRGAAVDQGRVR